MNTPSQGVAQPLQQHVHLISSNRYPLVGSLSLPDAFRWLVEAPTLVKQGAPMSWMYVSAPQDGTVWLEWLPPDKADHFPSDGYVWADPEQTYHQEIAGYRIELRTHTMGYRPGAEQIFQHARTRYHLIAKNMATNAAPPDPSLWVVHYHAADPSHAYPITSMHIQPQMQQIMAQRRWLESQGRLERKEFMLHDRPNWPTLTLPGNMQANPRMQPAWPQPPAQGGSGGPPPKRPRIQGPNPASLPGPGDGAGARDVVQDTSIEDEENTAFGDFFDHLTQRDISLARYVQHHRWIEEVFSSPYGTHQIVPPDLGLGLMGELKGLTDGILNPPSVDLAERPENQSGKAEDAVPLTTLTRDQMDEFSERIKKHLEDGQAEIERMKAEHAAKMQDWKKVKALTQGEKKLRYAEWEDYEQPPSALRLLDAPAANGHTDESVGKENVEDIVREVESLFKAKISTHESATRIARGGLKDRKPPAFDSQRDAMGGIEQMQHLDASTTSGLNGTTAAPTASTARDGQLAPNVPSAVPEPSYGTNHVQGPTRPNQGGFQVDEQTPGEALEDIPEMDMDDMMDMDVDDSNLDFDDPAVGIDAAPEVPPSAQAAGASSTSNTVAPGSAVPVATQASAQPDATGNTTSAGNNGSGANSIGDDGDMFNDDAFGDLTNIDGGPDDGLIDFDGGMGMDDSAFGDALHGMDDTGTPAADRS